MDFGILAEWYFHATAHEKGPCDGIGGNLKRQPSRAKKLQYAINILINQLLL